MGCSSILLEPYDVEMNLLSSLKARSEAIEHLGRPEMLFKHTSERYSALPSSLITDLFWNDMQVKRDGF